MNFTDEEFETLKNRYIQKLRYSRNKFLNESRKIETAAQAYGLSYLFTDNLPMDEFSQEVSRVFDWLYEIGKPIDEIIYGLYNETRINHLNELKERPEQRIVKVHKQVWKIKLPLIKYYETFDYKGELTSRFKLKRNWRGIFKIDLSEAQSKDEIEFILFHQLNRKEYLFQKSNPMTSSIISFLETDIRKWFKALVKYRANKEFLPELYLSELPPNEQKTLVETKEKRKRETTKLVKWTDGKNKNSFVKLIYSLHHSKYIDKGEGEVTNTVESLAPIFGLELNDWESNFSKGITEQGYAYDHGAFFDDLKNSYLEIVKSRIETKELKKKIKKELDEKQGSKED